VNVVDSSAWLEYFGDDENAPEFAGPIESTETLLVPTLTLFEVFKRTCVISDEATALEAMAVMLQGTVIGLTAELALEAARLSLGSGLAMADSIILATARAAGATLWTQDAPFEGMPGVEFRAKSGSAG
jgi:predicted nucleic acid-binding protein